MSFDPGAYGPKIAAILGDGARLAELGPGTPDTEIEPLLRALRAEASLTPTCQSGLWLYHDFLDESHTISQDISTPDGSFWHAIMHRREPDASNSKYWWRKVGDHPVIEQLRTECPAIGYRYTTPFDFVDLCEKVRDTGSAHETLAKKVQLLEWQLLFKHCHRATQSGRNTPFKPSQIRRLTPDHFARRFEPGWIIMDASESRVPQLHSLDRQTFRGRSRID